MRPSRQPENLLRGRFSVFIQLIRRGLRVGAGHLTVPPQARAPERRARRAAGAGAVLNPVRSRRCHRGRRRSLVATAALAALSAAALGLGSAASAGAAVPASAGAAGTWLEHQITANGGGLPGSGLVPGHPYDVGLTEDAVLALTAAGEGTSAAARAATATAAAQATWFTTVNVSSVRLAGPLAKTLLVAEVQGADPHAFGGTDIEGRLRAVMATSGASAGRFEDQGAGADSSNGFSQALAILGLLRTTGGVPPAAVTFLLQQQCPGGGFRLLYDSGSSCSAATEDDPDATGLAVQALSALPASASVTAARDAAVAWLKSAQNPTTGSFSGSGPTANVPNANSTGLAALRPAPRR